MRSAAVTIACALTVVLIVRPGTTTHAEGKIHAPAVAFLDAASGRLLAQVPGDQPGIIRFGEGSIWALQQAGILLEINPRTLKVTRSIPLGDIGGGSDIAVGEGAVWVTEHSQALLHIDPRYGSVTRIRLPQRGLSQPGTPGGVATGAGSVWVAQGSSRVLRLDPATGHIQHRFEIPDANVVAFGDDAAWVSTTSDVGHVTKIDARTNAIAATARLGTGIPCLVVGGGYVWAADDGRLWKLSLADDVLHTLGAPSGCGGMSYGADGLWLAAGEGRDALITRIDPQTDRRTSYRTGHVLVGLGVAKRVLAVSVLPTTKDLVAGIKGRVLHVSFASHWPDLTDPATAAAPGDNGNSPVEQQLQFATCARLLTFPATNGAAREQLVPEVATSLPTRSADRRTYTFQIAPGYRFSPPSNAPVTATTFKYSIERALSPRLGAGAPALRLVPDIAGVRAYRTGRAAHIAGITARGDTLAIRLAHPAPDFPERIAASYFCPVPIGTPLGSPSAGGGGLEQPIPSAGPYYLTGENGGEIDVLRRNPNYHGPRPQHLDAVVYRAAHRVEDAVAGVASGSADYVEERGAPLAADSPIARRFGHGSAAQRRYVLTPLAGTDELVFNPRSRLVQSAAVRRAISLALDRPTLAAAIGDLATDRYLPPGMPGSTGGLVHPVDRRSLRAARTLMRGRTGRVRLAVCMEPRCTRVGRTVRANLQRIGIRVDLARYGGDIGSATRRPGADITLARVLALYPEPVAFLRAALGDAAPRRRLRAISLLDRPRRIAAAAHLEKIVLRNSAPAAPFGTPAIPQFFSRGSGAEPRRQRHLELTSGRSVSDCVERRARPMGADSTVQPHLIVASRASSNTSKPGASEPNPPPPADSGTPTARCSNLRLVCGPPWPIAQITDAGGTTRSPLASHARGRWLSPAGSSGWCVAASSALTLLADLAIPRQGEGTRTSQPNRGDGERVREATPLGASGAESAHTETDLDQITGRRWWPAQGERSMSRQSRRVQLHGGLPRAGSRVPAPQAGHNLPAPAAGGRFPAPVAGGRLPAPVAGGRLPAPVAGGRLPAPVAGAKFPGPVAARTLPARVAGNRIPAPIA